MKLKFARCHFTDDYVKVISYMGMGNYQVEYPDGEMQSAHESTLDFDGAIEISFPTWGKK